MTTTIQKVIESLNILYFNENNNLKNLANTFLQEFQSLVELIN